MLYYCITAHEYVINARFIQRFKKILEIAIKQICHYLKLSLIIYITVHSCKRCNIIQLVDKKTGGI